MNPPAPPLPPSGPLFPEKGLLLGRPVEQWIKIIVGLAIVILTINITIFVVLSILNRTKKESQQFITAPIEGSIDLNGYIPGGSTIDIVVRKNGTEEFIAGVEGINAQDGATWRWPSGTEGVSYDIKALLRSSSGVISESPIKSIAAPASEETLRIVSTAIPPTTPTTTPGAPTEQLSSISGILDLNGVVPAGSTIIIQAKKPGDTAALTIATLKANDGVSWNWNTAPIGVLYEIQASLMNAGTTVGTSGSITVAAPASNERIVIHTKTQTTAKDESISGVIDLNGYIPNNASITVSFRKSGTPTFIAGVTNLPARDRTSWMISQLQAGTSYDILAYLQINGQNYAQSQLLVIPAPAHNEELVINSQNRPASPPSNSQGYSCVGKGGNNQWQATITFNQNQVCPDAKQFILQLGSTGGDSSILNNQITPDNPTTMQTYTTGFVFNENQTYYAQYACAPCKDCKDLNFFSQFSPPMAITCSTKPTSTNTPSPTISPSPQPTAVPTMSPTNSPTPTISPTPSFTPTPTEKLSACNESCGGSGYQCVDGLSCVSGEGIGSSICRNPNCPTKENCSCDQ